MRKKVFTQDAVYSLICKNPGLCAYDMAKKLNMSNGRVNTALRTLSHCDLLKFKIAKNPRKRKNYYSIDAFKMLPADTKKELKKFL